MIQEIKLMKRLDVKQRTTKKTGKTCNVVTYEAIVNGDVINVDVWDWQDKTAEGQTWTATINKTKNPKFNDTAFLDEIVNEDNNLNETRYEDIDDNPLIDDKPKPKPAFTATISTPEGTFPAVYTDFTHRTNALDAACKAVRGLTREVKAHEIIAMAQEFEAYLRGE
uniref:Uncharacterized protein n=1 Tax=viral metagenome TaxID=1070528 RepID=A0A6M3JMH2_9ZZZZ